MRPPIDHPLILFDGHCGLCHRSVRFVLHRDRADAFRFAQLKGRAAQALLAEAPSTIRGMDSVILVDEVGGFHVRSDAARQVLARLGPGWRFLGWLLGAVPRRARDTVYDAVARRRRRWFEQYEVCPLPADRDRHRFLD